MHLSSNMEEGVVGKEVSNYYTFVIILLDAIAINYIKLNKSKIIMKLQSLASNPLENTRSISITSTSTALTH